MEFRHTESSAGRRVRDLLLAPPSGEGRTSRVLVHRFIRGTSAEALFELRRDPQNLVHFHPVASLHVQSPGRPMEKGDMQRIWWNTPLGRLVLDLETIEVTHPFRIVDLQVDGPFRYWRHQHIAATVRGMPALIDVIDFRSLRGPVGQVVDALFIAPLVRAEFKQQQRALERLIFPRPGSEQISPSEQQRA